MRKDMLLGIMLCAPMMGFGHMYAGDKRRGLMILGIQLAILVLTGVAMVFSSFVTTLLFFGYIVVGFWALYDTIVTINLVNDSIR